jgi:hypothetical protein
MREPVGASLLANKSEAIASKLALTMGNPLVDCPAWSWQGGTEAEDSQADEMTKTRQGMTEC